MAYIVPSEAIRVIDHEFGWAQQGANVTIDRTQSTNLAAVLAVVRSIPSELITVDAMSLADLTKSVARWMRLCRRVVLGPR